ncbi:b12d protein [Trifolium pratense]|uniref:B12d protein n=1 Tax=Trifolium pratense TaxID=57577 RepID=A0A2K3MCL4_TRIPR|nr:b12d protein [Trifolium pratense]
MLFHRDFSEATLSSFYEIMLSNRGLVSLAQLVGHCGPMVTKQNRAAGILDNFSEGEKYSQHFVRRFVRDKSPQIMPGINNFFSDPEI